MFRNRGLTSNQSGLGTNLDFRASSAFQNVRNFNGFGEGGDERVWAAKPSKQEDKGKTEVETCQFGCDSLSRRLHGLYAHTPPLTASFVPLPCARCDSPFMVQGDDALWDW